MQTIGKKWHGDPGDYTAMCDLCGVYWPRSKLWKDAAGSLRCPDEGDGRDAVTLSRLEARASRKRFRKPASDGRKDTAGPDADGMPELALEWANLSYENSATRYAWIDAQMLGPFSADTPVTYTDERRRFLLNGPGLTNLLTYSEDLSQWTQTTNTAAYDVAGAPDGTTTADRFQPGFASISQQARQDVANTSTSTDSTISIFYKLVEAPERFRIQMYNRDPSSATAVMVAGAEWKRGSVGKDSGTGGNDPYLNMGSDGLFAAPFATILIWGAQYEESPFMSSYYVPTEGSAVTQPKDKSSMPTTASFLTRGWSIEVAADFAYADVASGSSTRYIFYLASDEYLAFVDDSGAEKLVWATPGGTVTISDVGNFPRGRRLSITCDFVNGYMELTGSALPQRQSGTVSDWTGSTVYVGMDDTYSNHFPGWISEPHAMPIQRTGRDDL